MWWIDAISDIVIFIGGAGILVIFLIIFAQIKRKAKSWPNTIGTVTKARILRWKIPEIEYEYWVEKEKFKNSWPPALQSLLTPFSVESLINKYPVGCQVTVYYNPRHPIDSDLNQSVSIEGIIRLLFILLVSLAVLAVGIFMSIKGW